ncbi:uncharacterized protein TNCT_350751 [Trichonephila clavata]|uniref:C-factor n=2 Tax=Trichonephila clavata TaxID=2740835 RepID=A0A8X6G5U0_TRICU|nr:uncharacterized protein TNCT_350751 [Trichonephila clavata]
MKARSRCNEAPGHQSSSEGSPGQSGHKRSQSSHQQCWVCQTPRLSRGYGGELLLIHFHTNTVGPFMVVQEFLPLLKKAADRSEGTKLSVSRSAVVNISAGNGSITTATFDFPVIHAAVGYRVSKAASNMAMRMIAPALTKSGILDIQMCPGWVKTDMGSPAAELEVSDSIAAMLKTMEKLNESHQGAFIDRNGEPIPF